jgi:hypothetical protein
MSHFRLLLFIASIVGTPVFLHAQKLDSMMNIYANNYPQEKVYVQFDKKIYNPGETIWWKAYVFTGADPSLFSKNFYAELTDPEGKILQRKVYPILEASAAGDFDVPKNLKSKHLHFRAYTTWMTNFDTAFFYEKDLRIFDKRDSVIAISLTAPQSMLQFFPEGGDMVAGVESMVAFKANDMYGIPVNVSGVIVDRTGKTVSEFSSEHDGMGKFLITPDKNDSLVAVWKDPQHVEHHTGLPAVKGDGVVLRTISVKDKLLFSVARGAESGPESRHLEIIAHMHQHMIYKARINLDENFMSGGTIPTGQLPSGVLQVTVFNDAMVPLAERVAFVNNHEFSYIPVVALPAKSVVKRGRNTLEIEIPDSLKANFSVAVTDAAADGEFPVDDNIISRLLLTGDVKGYVHDPNYYFTGRSDSLINQLDLVMMTHGWRRFRWDQLVKGQLPNIKAQEQDFLSLKVEVLGVDPYKIAKEESLNVFLSKKDSSTQMLSVPHQSGNKFGVTGLVFYDTVKVYYMFNLNHKLSSEAAITFNNGLLQRGKAAKPLMAAFEGWTAEDSAYLRRNRYILEEAARVKPIEDARAKTLTPFTVRGRVKTDAEKLDEKYASGMFAGGDAYTFDLVNDPLAASQIDIFQYLQGKVPGLQITPGSGPGGVPGLSWRGGRPTLYLNEMQVDASQLQSTPVPDIAMVKVFRPGSGVGFGGGAGGVIAIYTKKGGDERKNNDNIKGLDRTILVGYSMMKEFYSPNYLQNDPDNEKEDLRTTLYWKPFILLDKDNRKFSVDFFNTDVTRKIRIMVEGFNEDGKLCHVEKIIQ